MDKVVVGIVWVTGACVRDIALVVDTSGSIEENQPSGVNNVQLIKDFLRQLLGSPVNIGPSQDRVGMVTFESSARTLFNLGQRLSFSSVMSGINQLPAPNGETNTPAAINLALEVRHQLYHHEHNVDHVDQLAWCVKTKKPYASVQ